ncbi:hypothetical protein B0E45_26155 [Sinorhizobium sp. A49]|uniref:DUF927 domain-containing protein n=1 Tax=Sinorhizobium sp. A49 TaxID=1945861 RepID=UPI000986386D|nr:DUF927 domain-containing protein [Sinorhizobium sp. A49]OOG66724.1 hypothetical protein B0E45_26155 [Sinorhizobium sp. A49]
MAGADDFERAKHVVLEVEIVGGADNPAQDAIEPNLSRTSDECRQAWATAIPWRDDPFAVLFLKEKRGLDLALIPDDVARVIPDWRLSHSEKARPQHSLVYAMRSVATGEVVAFQIRRFVKHGDKVGQLLVTRAPGNGGKPVKTVGSGPKSGAVVMVGPHDAKRVILVDGQEDALAIWQAIGGASSSYAVWATTAVSFGGHFWPVVPGRSFVFLCDAGHEEAMGRKAAARMADAGHEVWVAPPPVGRFPDDFRDRSKAGQAFKDANDAVLAGQPQAIVDALKAAAPARAGQGRDFDGADDMAGGESADDAVAVSTPLFGRFVLLERHRRDRLGRYHVHKEIRVKLKPKRKAGDDTGGGGSGNGGGSGPGGDSGGGGDDDGPEETAFLCSYFEVIGRLINRRGKKARLVIKYDGRRHVLSIEDLMVSTERTFAGLDININSARLPDLKTLLRTWHAPRLIDVGQGGYIDLGGGQRGFMTIAGQYIGPKTPERYELIETQFGDVEDFRPSGTLAEWRELVARPALKHPHAAMALGFAFASCILRLIDQDNFGVLWSGESGQGKSMIVNIAATLVGDPQRCVFSADTSEAAFYRRAGAFSDHPLLYEEKQGGKKAEAALAFVTYGHAKGVSPDRVDADADALRELISWKSIAQMSGEVSPADMAARGDFVLQAGQEARLLTLKLRSRLRSDGNRQGLDLLDGGNALYCVVGLHLRRQYGTAYPAFVDHLSRLDADDLRARRDEVAADYLKRLAFDESYDSGNIRRAAMSFAVAAVALEVAFAAGVLPRDRGHVSRCANGMKVVDVPFHFLELWIEQRDGMGVRDHREILRRLRVFVATEMRSFGPLDYDGKPVDLVHRPACKGFLQADYFNREGTALGVDAGGPDGSYQISEALHVDGKAPNPRFLWIPADVLFDALKDGGYDREVIKAVLRDKGIVTGQRDGNKWRFEMLTPKKLAKSGQPYRMVRVDLVALYGVD